MEIKGKVTIPAREIERVIEVRCDFCGLLGDAGYGGVSDWSKSCYSVAETTVNISRGSRYPGGKSIDVEFFNICPDCWDSKLKPLMQSAGANCNYRHDSD